MLLTNQRMGRMSEASIAEQYSVYLQNVMIFGKGLDFGKPDRIAHQGFLSYDEFKDYYILALIGNQDYANILASKIQRQNLIENA